MSLPYINKRQMEKRRKRRSVEDIEKSIRDAATQIIKESGFSGLTATGIMQKAEIEPVQFYKRYKDLDAFIDEYVKSFDYWFSDMAKAAAEEQDDKVAYEKILCSLFTSLWDNKLMQELLRWEISTHNETSRRTAQLRELHTLPLNERIGKLFSGNNTDIVAISSLIVGGLYYLILHNRLSTFSGINLDNESDRKRIMDAVRSLSDLLFAAGNGQKK